MGSSRCCPRPTTWRPWGVAADGAEALDLAVGAKPDVVLMDLSMPGLDGIEATQHLLGLLPRVQVVVLTSFSDQDLVLEAIDAGAVGYLLKDSEPKEVLRGIRAAAEGGSPFSGKAARALISRQPALAERLTERQREILTLVARGLPNRQIAARLQITEGTVKAHLTGVYHAIGVSDRAQAADWARRHGLVRRGR
jgi:DNA-binding NarL/FixJ family response regulator